jgi:hypothetical protein
VVYGPRAPLRAYRASLQLMQAMAIVIVSVTASALRFSRAVPSSVFGDDLPLDPGFSISFVLRC